ncbi:MAG TPA: diacylglycerol kinase family protein [Anaerolineales bacterium]|nr:diacylglycerol kinase family protein [Anaerolineales bacterium]
MEQATTFRRIPDTVPEAVGPQAYVIFHPGAGGADQGLLETLLSERLGGAGRKYVLHRLSPEDDPSTVAREAIAQRVPTILAAGGDGTVSRVAAGLIASSAELGVLPVGTGNGLARALGLPMDLASAIDLVAGAHAVRTIDVLEAEGRTFLLNASMGLSSQAFRPTSPEVKRRFGWAVYLWNGLEGLMGLQPYRFRLSIDGRYERTTGTDLLLLNTIGFIPGLPSDSFPDVKIDDGKLEVGILRARHALAYVLLAARLILGKPVSRRELRRFTVERDIRVDSRPSVPVQADGDVVGWTPMTFRVLNNALKVIVPTDGLGWRGKEPA